MKRFGILGHPLKHTMSPFLHEALFQLAGVTDVEYKIYDIPQNELQEKKDFLRALDGLNITIPYKVEMLSFADKLSDETALFRSVNCFQNEGGFVTAFNTDVDGFLKAVAELDSSLTGRVLLLGAGGVAQTMAVSAVQRGASLTIAVRKEDFAAANALQARASQYGKQVEVTTLDNINGDYDLLINATPVGMYPNIAESPITESVVKHCGAVFDAVYNPKETELYRIAKSHGIKVSTGMSMLVYQAVRAHELWYGAKFSEKDVKKLISDASQYMEEHFK